MDRIARRRATLQQGLLLVEALVAMLILMLGMLALARLQAQAVIEGRESQMRATASGLAEELLALGLADPSNAPCYAVPSSGLCGNARAQARAAAWAAAATRELHGPATARSLYDPATGRLSVALSWSARDGGGVHELRMVTDVRR